MKKVIVFGAVMCVLCGLVFAGPKGNGAIKVDLCVSDNGTPIEPVVGWVVFNVNAEGIVIAEMHINDGDEGTYDVMLNPKMIDLQKVTINKAGKGNAHLSGDLGDNTQVRVNVLPEEIGGQTHQIYTTGWVTPSKPPHKK